MSTVAFLKIEDPQLEKDRASFNKMMNALASEVAGVEDKLLFSILQKELERDPVLEDIKECEAIYHAGDSMTYMLLYKKKPLGTISKKAGEGTKLTITFMPATAESIHLYRRVESEAEVESIEDAQEAQIKALKEVLLVIVHKEEAIRDKAAEQSWTYQEPDWYRKAKTLSK